jgi:collagenase-like PrtC family protease
MFLYLKENAPELKRFVSTQANICSYQTVKFWQDLGADLCVLGREVSYDEMAEIRKHCPDIKLETFIHGAMCMSYSGICLISNFLADRSANQGKCAHCCRWHYKLHLRLKDGTIKDLEINENNKDMFEYLVKEEFRPGELYEIVEDEHGAYIMNSKDLCLMPRLDKILELGLHSLKIEGRNKTEYYAAITARAYRQAIDDYYKNPEDVPVDENGVKDFECLEALRIDDFNKDLKKVFNGEKVKRCVFDFVKGKHTYLDDDILQLPPKDSGKTGVVLCEGLHGIDPKATASIPRDEKFFIYIAPLTPMNSDEYNFFADYILRLYRRMIRDFRTRNRNASATLAHWFGVEKGEKKYIFPYIDSSDLIWNSSLDYELSVMYTFVYPLLRTVNVKDPNYYLACYLMNTLVSFLPISDEEIEKTAVLREFIGGSLFE